MSPGLKSSVKTMLSVIAVAVYFIALFWLLSWWVSSFSQLQLTAYMINAPWYEPIALLLTYGLLLLLLCRPWFTLLLTSVLYLGFLLLNAELVKVLGTVLTHRDVAHSAQLLFAWDALFSYWLELLIALWVLVLLYWLARRERPLQALTRHRPWMLSVALLGLFVVFLYSEQSSQWIKRLNGLPGKSVPRVFSEQHGMLFSFYYRLLNSQDMPQPEGYSQQAVHAVLQNISTQPTGVDIETPPNVIIFFIEAFSDPWMMGLNTSRDPIPNFRALAEQHASGMVLSPEMGGRSANPEFELLTGFSLRFFPTGSIPYLDSITEPLISVPWQFKRAGYQTNALHVAHLAFFNYRKTYPLLGFDRVETLWQKPGVPLDVARRFPSEQALVDAIIAKTEHEQPQFIFAFPNSTHGFWDYPGYLDSDLEVSGSYIGAGDRSIKTYVNALHSADQAIGQLVSHFAQSEEKTLILIMGDHQPSLPEYRQQLIMSRLEHSAALPAEFASRKEMKKTFKKLIKQHADELYDVNHKVPYVIWTNYPAPRYDQDLSMNLLATRLFEAVPVKPEPWFHFLNMLRGQVTEVSHKIIAPDGRYMSDAPAGLQALIDQYRLLQYDVFQGENHYQQLIQD